MEFSWDAIKRYEDAQIKLYGVVKAVAIYRRGWVTIVQDGVETKSRISFISHCADNLERKIREMSDV